MTVCEVLPNLTPAEVSQIATLTGLYLATCWVGRIMIRMMT